MDRGVFEERLSEIGRRVVLFAREHVVQQLPDEVEFRVYPNQSYDDNPRVGDEIVFSDESLPNGEFLGPLGRLKRWSRTFFGGQVKCPSGLTRVSSQRMGCGR